MRYAYLVEETLQHEGEIEAVLDFILGHGPLRTVLEIGTHLGGTAHLWLQVVGQGKVILVDKAFNPKRVYLGMKTRATAIEIEGSSLDPAVRARVERALSGAPVDLLFIDGDHDYNSARQDFEYFRRFVRPGGWIALHDVFNPGCGGLRAYWHEIKGEKYEYFEFDAYGGAWSERKLKPGVDQPLGIGLIHWKG